MGKNKAQGTTLNWYYCTSMPCSTWTSLVETLGFESNYLYLKAELFPSTTNLFPEITSITINYSK